MGDEGCYDCLMKKEDLIRQDRDLIRFANPYGNFDI